MLANRTSRWSIGAALLCIIALAASYFLLISPRRADAAAVRDQVSDSDSQAAQLQVKIAELKAEFAELPKRKAELKAIKTQLPPKADVPTLVRDLQSIAAQAGVSLDSLGPGSPTVLGPAGTTVTADVGSVVSVPMSMTITGDYFEASLFVKYLQTKVQRSYLITAIDVASAEEEVAATTPPTAAAPTAAPTSTATASPVPVPVVVVPTVAPTVATPTLDRVTLGITGSVFVLMDGTTTLEDVKREAKAAAEGRTLTPAPAPTAADGTATTTTN